MNLIRASCAALGLGDRPTVSLISSAELRFILQPVLRLTVAGRGQLSLFAFGNVASLFQELRKGRRETKSQISLVINFRYRWCELSCQARQGGREISEIVGNPLGRLSVLRLMIDVLIRGGMTRLSWCARTDLRSDAESLEYRRRQRRQWLSSQNSRVTGFPIGHRTAGARARSYRLIGIQISYSCLMIQIERNRRAGCERCVRFTWEHCNYYY